MKRFVCFNSGYDKFKEPIFTVNFQGNVAWENLWNLAYNFIKFY